MIRIIVAAVVCLVCFAGCKQSPAPVLTDPVAQRIYAIQTNISDDYTKMVLQVIQSAKKDTVYRDTCRQ